MNKIDKTILIAHNFSEDSFSNMSYQFAHHLSKTGIKVIFISHKPYLNDIVEFNNGKLIVQSWSSIKRPTGLKDFYHYYKIHKKYKPDIIISHFVGVNISSIVSKILSLWKTKVFVYYHTLSEQIIKDNKKKISIIKKIKKIRKKYLYKLFVDTVLCPSRTSEIDLNNFYGIFKSKVVLNPTSDRYKSKNIDFSSIKISFLGRIDPSKGVFQLIESFKMYVNSNSKTRIVLEIAGTGSMDTQLKESIAGCSNISYKGRINYDEVDCYINNSHFMIIPSLNDAFNVVAIESLMNATPVLITNSTGVSEYLKDEECCYKFNVNTEEFIRIFQKVEEITLLDYKIMSEKSRATFLNNFTIEKYCDSMYSLIADSL